LLTLCVSASHSAQVRSSCLGLCICCHCGYVDGLSVCDGCCCCLLLLDDAASFACLVCLPFLRVDSRRAHQLSQRLAAPLCGGLAAQFVYSLGVQEPIKAYMQPSRPACLDGQGQPNVFGFPINKGTRPPGFRNWTCRCLVQRRGLPSQVLAVVRPPADASVCVLDLCAFSACTS
jgi:hypothetical protein